MAQKINPISAYLIHSYLYYVMDAPVVDDAQYDQICVELLEKFDELKHPHKHLLDKEALRAGSGYHIATMDYPLIVRNMAMNVREDPMYLDNLAAKPLPKEPVELSKTPMTPKKPMSLLDF